MSSLLFEKHQDIIESAMLAIHARKYFSPYPENPKTYGEEAHTKGKSYVAMLMNSNYTELKQTGKITDWAGEEVSPYLQTGLGTQYPIYDTQELIDLSSKAMDSWKNLGYEERLGILTECLERIKGRFFDIAYATMHTTGQSFMMSFQASGPHSNDRALEAAIMGYMELKKFVSSTDWIKPLGKFDLVLKKEWRAIPKGVGLCIGCSTFPVWNTVPAIFANLITGNSCIVKPHPKAILPIAIFISEIQAVLAEQGIDVNVVQLAVDRTISPITKILAEHKDIHLIDFTGSSEFGNYIESLHEKTVFTEKAGVNSVIIDSVKNLDNVMQNLAFSICLYSGQMCTAPQNIFISKHGVETDTGIVSFDMCAQSLIQAITSLVDNPKSGAATLGAIQTDVTLKRVQEIQQNRHQIVLASKPISNEEFIDARVVSPVVLKLKASEYEFYNRECFGPIVFIIETEDLTESIYMARKLAIQKGALTCAAYTTNDENKALIADSMNNVFVPVSFNFTGAAFINSHAAFSDLHVTGGNAAGNASLTNSEFVSRRFVWVGNRYA